MSDVCKEYGGGLYLLAAEAKSKELFFGQLLEIKKIFEENPAYLSLLSSPSVVSSEKRALIEEAFGGRAHEYIVNFMCLMCDRGYFGYINGCIEHFKKVYYEKNNVKEGVVKSAYALSESEKEALSAAVKEKLGGINLILEYVVDESLLGGFLVEVDGKVMDSTLKTKLAGLKNVLSSPV